MIQDYAPIVAFAYNRPRHIQTMLTSLQQNDLADKSDLFVFCDGPKSDATVEDLKKIQEVRSYVHSVTGFKNIQIIEREKNVGLDPSEIEAITDVISHYGKIIVLEDDLVLNKFFLRFMNDALECYKMKKNVFQVSGFADNLDCLQKMPSGGVYASFRPESLGWGTWKDRWDLNHWNEKEYDIILHPTKRKIRKFNRGGEDLYPMLIEKLKGRTDAWDIRWGNTMYENNALCVRPNRSLLYNIGFDGTGVHCGVLDQKEVMAMTAPLYDEMEYRFVFNHNIRVNKEIQRSLNAFFHVPKESLLKLVKRRIKKFLQK